jgi:riboflavin kinase/FMN adenylyltransferase
MLIAHSLAAIPPLPTPIALAIGVFDGVHPGHLHLFQELKKHSTPVVLTFSNHPATVLGRPEPRLLCSLEERLERLEKAGITLTIVLPFTPDLAQTSYDQFLKTLKAHLPFTTLIFGQGETIGRRKEGDEAHLKALEPTLGFKVLYLEKLQVGGEVVSSSRLRTLLQGEKT